MTASIFGSHLLLAKELPTEKKPRFSRIRVLLKFGKSRLEGVSLGVILVEDAESDDALVDCAATCRSKEESRSVMTETAMTSCRELIARIGGQCEVQEHMDRSRAMT